jgi:hypothetical protein
MKLHAAPKEILPMTVYMHKDCREPAVERPDAVSPEMPTDFPFTCLSCLGEIEDHSDLYMSELMSQ